MRTKRATRYSKPSDHNQFGIYNWFRTKGVSDKDAMKDTIHSFCESFGFNMSGFNLESGKEKSILNWVGNRFQQFATFAGWYLKDNNYI